MDYEKKYKEALEKARQLCAYPTTKPFISDLQDIFPELAESWDKKIRKRLITDFGTIGKKEWGGLEVKDILAWLKKQGEQKPLGYVHHIDEDGYYTKEAILEPNPYTGTGFDYNGHHWGMCARDGGVEILMDGNITSRVFPDKNNIIEQKPTDSYCQENCKGFQETGKCFADGECKAKRKADSTNEVKPKFKVGDKIYLKPEYRMQNDDTPIANTVKEIRRIDDKYYRFDGSYIFIEDQDKYELVEQKAEENKGNLGGISSDSEWGKEDKSIIEEVVSYLINYSNIVESKEDADRIEYLIDKIQDISPHHKQEWSEEDEKKRKCLIKGLEDRMGFGWASDPYSREEYIDWLKSLRPQNKWKPSELQLGCLSDAIEHYNSLGYPASKLKELLNDLKKLKEGEV